MILGEAKEALHLMPSKQRHLVVYVVGPLLFEDFYKAYQLSATYEIAPKSS